MASTEFGQGPEILFSPKEFLIRSRSILRISSFLLSFISFCCIVSIVDECIFGAQSTCGFTKFVTSFGWITSIILLVFDWFFPSPSGFLDTTAKRRGAVVFELVFSGLWTLFYFALFCATASGWRKMANQNDSDEHIGFGAGNAKAIISFCFISCPLWGYQCYLSYFRYQTGNFALPQYDDDAMQGARPFASFPAPNVQSTSTFQKSEQISPSDLTY